MSMISASQIDTYEDCNRFWWFQRILKLQEPPAAHFTFGTVLHAVNERYLSATENQRVPDEHDWAAEGVTPWMFNSGTRQWVDGPLEGQVIGRPVNLYPPGWDTATERDGSTATVTKNEAKLIQKLVKESIENGVLRWREGTQVERKVLLSVIKGVQLIGYIDAFKAPTDVQILPLIEDHKSFGKGSLRYLKNDRPDSPNYLGHNQQVKTYAWATSELDGWTGDVTVRHNQYPKFPGKGVTAVETTITRREIVEHGKYLRDVAEHMERTRGIKKWADVPGPKDTGKCSRWYGKPCPFSDICGRAETPDAYKARLDRLKSGSLAVRPNLPLEKPRKRTKGTTMNIFDRAKNQKAKRAGRKAKAGTTKAEASVNGAEPAPVTTVTGGAPWANPECKACKGRGLTSKHKACPICDNTAKRGKRPTSMSYVIDVTDEGIGIAAAREEHTEALEAAGMPLDWDEESTATSAPEEAPTPAPEPEIQPEPAQEATKPAKRKRRTKAEMAAAKAAEQAIVDAHNIELQEAEQAKSNEAMDARSNAAKANRGGRPTVGLIVMVGAMYLRGLPGGRQGITSSEVLARFGTELAKDMGAESYWLLDTWKRRERLAEKADYIVSSLAKHVVVHPGELGNDDVGSLVRALMGAQEGIEAVIMGVG